jgi:Icc-related predicted phosphoesterase
MRILTLSDKVEPLLYGPTVHRTVGQVDMVLGCGDLPDYYLDYVVSVLNVPCYYVQGNHAQGEEFRGRVPEEDTKHRRCAPPGCNVHGRVVHDKGLLIAGLEGSMRYNRNPRFQYTDRQMQHQLRSMAPRLLRNWLRHGRFLDILITHAPPRGIHDGPDVCHQGFGAYLSFMRWFRPRYLIHGHKHVHGPEQTMQTVYHHTQVINTYGYRIVEIDQG